jgi:hypothetical protein
VGSFESLSQSNHEPKRKKICQSPLENDDGKASRPILRRFSLVFKRGPKEKATDGQQLVTYDDGRPTVANLTLTKPLGNPNSSTSIPRAILALKCAVGEFEEHCRTLAADRRQFIQIDNDVHCAIQNAALEEDISRSAELFANQINATLVAAEVKENIRKSTKSWTYKLGKFLTRLYPVTRFSLQLTSALAEVTTNY